MTVSLGAITLDDNLRLDGHLIQAGLAASARSTMGGVAIQTMAMPSGRQLALVASLDGDTVLGLFTRAQLLSLAALRDAGDPVALVHHELSCQVWLPPTAIDVAQVFDYADPDAESWYVGTISMITV